jgi:hypothetical protein
MVESGALAMLSKRYTFKLVSRSIGVPSWVPEVK